MAYAAVTSLIQTLEYLLKFPQLLFEVEINRAKTFNKEVDQLIEVWELDKDVKRLQLVIKGLKYRAPSPDRSTAWTTGFWEVNFQFLNHWWWDLLSVEHQIWKNPRKRHWKNYVIFIVVVHMNSFGFVPSSFPEAFAVKWLQNDTSFPEALALAPLSCQCSQRISNFENTTFWGRAELKAHIIFWCGVVKDTTLLLCACFLSPSSPNDHLLQLAIERLRSTGFWGGKFPISEPLAAGSFVGRTSVMGESRKKKIDSRLNELYRLLEQFWGYADLKALITFCCEVAEETTLLFEELRHLLTFLDSPSNTNGHRDIMERIRYVANETRNFVDISIVDKNIEHAYAHFESGPHEIKILEQSLVNRVASIFLDKRFRERLLLSLKEVRSIIGKIKAPALEDLQSGSTSLDASSHGNSNQEDVVVGLDDDIRTIIEKLTIRPPFRREILTIVGMGGIGKTTLARKVFDNKSIVLHFHCRAWVTVSQVYQVKDLLFSLLCSVSQPIYERREKSKEEIGEELRRKLKGRTYLIVMDDLWCIEAWNAVQGYFPEDENGSRIMLTSRSIITEFKPQERPYHFVQFLDRDRSWELLEKVVFGRKSCPAELVDVGKQIAGKCHGLPLAIVVIAGLLSQIKGTLACWEDIADSVRSCVCSDAEKCLDILAFSYNKLPNRLKACWLYLVGFPEDCEIEVQKLVQLWIDEGFLDPKPIKEMEQAAEDNLRDLIGRNLILAGKRNFDGKVKSCRLHDFLRELCLREAEKEKFMYVLPRGAQRFRRGTGDMHRLSIHTDSISDVPSFPNALSLMCFSLGNNLSPDILLFELQLKLLRVLDIYFLRFDHFPSQILEMVHLRYIALNVTYELPASMSLLRNLQTILIRGPWGCPILSLEYWSMPSLRHLVSSVVCHLKNPTIGRKDLARLLVPKYLLSLSTISFSSCTREVFSIMPQLKKLCICETEKDYSMDVSSECLANLQLLCQLETLKCSFYRKTGKTRNLSPFALPSNLKNLTLSWSYLPWEEMTTFAILGHLTVLKLKNFAFQGPRWELNDEVVFGCLKSLLIDSTDLVHWEVTSTDNFPALKQLVMRSCISLEEIPCGVGELSTLSLIELHNCSKSAEDSANKFAEQFEHLRVVTIHRN